LKDYVILMTLTESGVQRLAEMNLLVAEWMDDWRDRCGTVTAFRVTLGGHDFVLLGEAEDDEMAAAFALRLTMGGLVKTTSMRAFREAALEDLMRKATRPSGRGIT
jgi:uncharacterized protein with GYD domain